MSTSIWDVIIPEGRTNLALNPSATITGNLTAIGAGTVSRVTTYSYFGPACHRIVASADNTGGYFTLKAATNAIHYCTMRIHTASDVATFDVSMDNSNWNSMTLLATEGSWWVYGVQIPAAQANGSVAFRVQQAGAGAIDLFIGHVQVEAGTYPTTPITGDLQGYLNLLDKTLPAGYKWEGQPHASASVRNAQERSGGRVVDVYDTYGIAVTWAEGIGMAPVTHHTQGYAMLPGMQFLGQKVEPRVLDVNMLMSVSPANETIHTQRKKIIDALKLDRVAGNQPVFLRYRGSLSTKPVEFHAYYDTGLGFDMGSDFNDQPTVRLICYDPFAYEVGTASAALTTSQSISDADYVVKRIDGTWSNVSTTFNAEVFCFAKSHDGCIYIGGSWTADVSTAVDGGGKGIIKYNPVTGVLTSLGTGVVDGNHTVNSMAVAPNGDLYITGDFLNAGGVAAADFAAMWDVSAGAWVALASGLGGVGNEVVIGQDGSVYFVGEFTNLTDANGDYITKWTGAAFVSLSTGLSAAAFGACIAPNGNLYVTGSFTTAGGVACGMQCAYWDGSAFNALGSGDMSGGADAGYCITTDPAGRVFVGGNFTSVGGVSATHLAMFDGAQWSTIGNPDSSVYAIRWQDGIMYTSGYFTNIGGVSVADRVAIYNGYVWAQLPIDLPGTPYVYGLYVDSSMLFLATSTAGTATSAYLNTITNAGTARAYPVVHIKREGGTSASVQWLRNETTGATLYLDYDLLDGEELIIDFRLGQRRVYSSFFGDVWRAVLRGSQFTEFYLQAGTNYISAYVAQVGSPTMTQYIEWVTTHEGADGAAA